MRDITERVDELRQEIRAISHEIHENPELGNEEFHSVELLTGLLKKHGFSVETGQCDMPTAFIASYKGSKPGPAIGYLAEYDALRGMGHACGHNMIGTLACCCAIALKEAIDELGGEVRVIGAPAEETMGGKCALADAGYYDDLAVAIMGHPAGMHAASSNMMAIDSQKFEFFGRASHAAASPEQGINALNAVLLTFRNIDALRQHTVQTARVHGIIRDGGKAANIVPDYASCEFYIRAEDSKYCRAFSERVQNCARAAALATGAELKITNFEGYYDNLSTNETLSARVIEHTHEYGVTGPINKRENTGSSDIGNVSYRCPCVHQWFDVVGDPNVALHTPELRDGADSDYGYEQMFIVAKAFVRTAEDVLSDPAFLAEIRAEFDKL
ncbi:MAG: M20 family metallopeptidase, partial [Firmicutes bacterium]|nr:M20 family metallopeptidase [Bacillota bacterium]